MNPPLQAAPDVLVIDYRYDPLNRLLAADYDNGESFSYSYDAVGNRLSEEDGGVETTYDYDAANRLEEVDGQEYLWDANGNLLFDGDFAYEYDPANRLLTVDAEDNSAFYEFTYNGLGDRLEQVVSTPGDGFEAVQYSLDLNAGLTQVLSDGSHAYLYGLGRIGEQDALAAWSYHLPDALGSIRQLTGGSGELELLQFFEPYGEELERFGEGASNYGYTGEWQDETGLLHLRARYYAPGQGRFISRDVWPGDLQRPLSLNKWVYVLNNPVLLTDPSGRCPAGDAACHGKVRELETDYGITVFWPQRGDEFPYPNDFRGEPKFPRFMYCRFEDLVKFRGREFDRWDFIEVLNIFEAFDLMGATFGKGNISGIAQGGVIFRANDLDRPGAAVTGLHCDAGSCSSSDPLRDRFSFENVPYAIGLDEDWSSQRRGDRGRRYTVIHEFGHRVNIRIGAHTDLEFEEKLRDLWQPFGIPTDNAAKNAREYFADAYALYVFEDRQQAISGIGTTPIRTGAMALSDIDRPLLLDGREIGRETLFDYFTDKVVPLVHP